MKRPDIQSIELNNVGFRTTMGESLFSELHIKLPQSGIYWVKSESGAGKSSFLRLINGVLAPSAGSVLINGRDIQSMTRAEYTPLRLQFGFSFDFGGLINNRSLFQNLSLVLEYHSLMNQKQIQETVDLWLERFGIYSLKDQRPAMVPGAVRKAICVIRAFIHEPQVLLLDDPTTGLRTSARASLINAINDRMFKRPEGLLLIATEDAGFINGLKIDGILEIKEHRIIKTEKSKEKVAA